MLINVGDRVRIKGQYAIYLVCLIQGQKVRLKMFGRQEFKDVNLWDLVKI